MVVILDEKWVGKVVVVTGASSGIGEAISERLVKEGMKVVGLARRKDRLNELANRVAGQKGEFYSIQTDISKEEDILNAFKWIKNNLGTIHAVINNAGVSKLSLFLESDTKKWNDILQVNVIGLSIVAREAVKSMKEGNFDGHIINMNSVLGHYPCNISKANMYPASKHAVTAITEMIRKELSTQGSKIKVTSISPGFVDTPIADDAAANIENVQKLRDNVTFLTPEDIAESVVYVLSTPQHVLVNELIIRPLGEV